jgi:3-methyladenine DNA glycosylase/8-oxoguanine DNA glycosylase
MVRSKHSIRTHVEALAGREPAFARVVEQHGVPEPRNSEPGAHTLLRTIVGQQVSVAAARSMWSKLEAAFGAPPDLNRLLVASDEELRAAGMSRQKSGYIRSLAQLVTSGELDLTNLPKDDEDAIALLTKIKGIGRWSAEIYLLFAEGRADVFPPAILR